MNEDIASKTIGSLFEDIVTCYNKYLEKYEIEPDQSFFLDKVYEELGELSQLSLSKRGMKPGGVPHDIQQRINEEAADVFCQIIVYICFTNADVWPTVRTKWLAELK